jgi:dethiobiotin synthetase
VSGLFITATDTGVGKTYVTAMLLAELRRRGVRAAGFKPISCGEGGRNDAKIFLQLMDNEVPLDLVNPIYLRHPLAPSVAAKLERRRIDFEKLFTAFRALATAYRVVLVEGAGGLMVPIRRGYFVVDLAKELGLPVVIVARLGLGTINHSLLTVRQAQAMGLKVRGIILNDTTGRKRGLAEITNIEVVPRLCAVPLLGVVPHKRKPDARVARRICSKLFGHAGVFE